MKLTVILENVIREEEEKKAIGALDQAMGLSFKTMGSELEKNQKELQQDVEQSNPELNEALGAIAIVGALLAAPKVVELIVRSFRGVVNVFKKLFQPGQAKSPDDQAQMANTIIEFTHKWHKSYIKGLKWILKTTGIFKKVGINDEAQQMKAAEAVYYVLVASLAVYSGVGAVSAFKSAVTGAANGGSFSLAAFEAAMASIKSSEVAEFVGKLGLKAA